VEAIKYGMLKLYIRSLPELKTKIAVGLSCYT
jgi:hypothetical protein